MIETIFNKFNYEALMNESTSIASAIVNQNTIALYEQVADKRVHSLTLIFLVKFEGFGSNAKALITNEFQVLKAPYKEGFLEWSKDELQRYLAWQTSPIVEKLNSAILAKTLDPDNLGLVLSNDEIRALKAFNKSDIGIKKADLDARLKGEVEKVAEKIQYELVDRFTY